MAHRHSNSRFENGFTTAVDRDRVASQRPAHEAEDRGAVDDYTLARATAHHQLYSETRQPLRIALQRERESIIEDFYMIEAIPICI